MKSYLSCIMMVVMLSFTNSIFAADENSLQQPSAVELAMWEFALSTGDPVEVRRFIDLYPDSIFSDDADEFIEMLAKESVEPEPGVAKSAEPESTIAEASEKVLAPVIGFDQPVAGDTISEQPKSLQQLADGAPLFPPVEELPEAYWKGQNCSNCHQWEKDNLCVQGEFFASHDENVFSRIQHPYGGFFKQALKEWAAGGCL